MKLFLHIVKNPIESAKAFVHGFLHPDDQSNDAKSVEARLNAIRMAILLYREYFKRFPQKLEDLCFNNHNDKNWDGESTFKDSFGHSYVYSFTEQSFELTSPWLDIWKKKQAEPCVPANPL